MTENDTKCVLKIKSVVILRNYPSSVSAIESANQTENICIEIALPVKSLESTVETSD